jgi:hypothetical protein
MQEKKKKVLSYVPVSCTSAAAATISWLTRSTWSTCSATSRTGATTTAITSCSATCTRCVTTICTRTCCNTATISACTTRSASYFWKGDLTACACSNTGIDTKATTNTNAMDSPIIMDACRPFLILLLV